jgi:hypothetical protein
MRGIGMVGAFNALVGVRSSVDSCVTTHKKADRRLFDTDGERPGRWGTGPMGGMAHNTLPSSLLTSLAAGPTSATATRNSSSLQSSAATQ